MTKQKTIVIIIVVSILVFTAAALIAYFTTAPKDIYTELSDIVNAKYDNTNLTVTTEQDGLTLTSTFAIVNNRDGTVTINYSVQSFALIDPDADNSNDVVTATGMVKLANGNVTQQTGDKVDVNFSNISRVKMFFAEQNFSDVKTENGIFSAKVTRPQSFLNAPSLKCSDMTISFVYSVSAQRNVIIHYNTEGGAAVTLTYNFS